MAKKKETVPQRFRAIDNSFSAKVKRLCDGGLRFESPEAEAVILELWNEHRRQTQELSDTVMQEYIEFNQQVLARARQIVSKAKWGDIDWLVGEYKVASHLIDLAEIFSGEIKPSPKAKNNPMVWYDYVLAHISLAAKLGFSPPQNPELDYMLEGRKNSAISRTGRVAPRDKAALARLKYLRQNKDEIVEIKRAETGKSTWRYTTTFERQDIAQHLMSEGLVDEGWSLGTRSFEKLTERLPATLKLKKKKVKRTTKKR
jgi:hypothetical protein